MKGFQLGNTVAPHPQADGVLQGTRLVSVAIHLVTSANRFIFHLNNFLEGLSENWDPFGLVYPTLQAWRELCGLRLHQGESGISPFSLCRCSSS